MFQEMQVAGVGGGSSSITCTMLEGSYYLAPSSSKSYTIDTSKIYCGAAMRYDTAYHNEYIYQNGTVTNTTTYYNMSVSGNTLTLTNNEPRACYLSLFEIG